VISRLPESVPEDETSLRVAVVGRPNVGKSSFVNKLLGEERLVVSEISGTTRDAIDTPLTYHGRKMIFVDTAGLRRQTKIDDGIEFYSSLRTRRSAVSADGLTVAALAAHIAAADEQAASSAPPSRAARAITEASSPLNPSLRSAATSGRSCGGSTACRYPRSASAFILASPWSAASRGLATERRLRSAARLPPARPL
jgi:hypothetical protein